MSFLIMKKKREKIENEDIKKPEEKETDFGSLIFSRAQEMFKDAVPLFQEERNEERDLSEWIDIPQAKYSIDEKRKDYSFKIFIFSKNQQRLFYLLEEMIKVGNEKISFENITLFLHAVQRIEKKINQRGLYELELLYIFKIGG